MLCLYIFAVKLFSIDAVPFQSLRKIINRFIRVEPSRKETYDLIHKSKLFSLTSIIDLSSQLGEETVTRLKKVLANNLSDFKSIPTGNHLTALGFHTGNCILIEAALNIIDKHTLNNSCEHVANNKIS